MDNIYELMTKFPYGIEVEYTGPDDEVNDVKAHEKGHVVGWVVADKAAIAVQFENVVAAVVPDGITVAKSLSKEELLKNIADFIGVKIGEKFDVNDNPEVVPYDTDVMITKDSIKGSAGSAWDSVGKCVEDTERVVHKNMWPSHGDVYFFVDKNKKVVSRVYQGEPIDEVLSGLGMCHKTALDAIEHGCRL